MLFDSNNSEKGHIYLQPPSRGYLPTLQPPLVLGGYFRKRRDLIDGYLQQCILV